MSDFDYESLLDRARDKIPDNISSRSRWKLPEPQILIEGSNTIFRNFTEVVAMRIGMIIMCINIFSMT